MASIYSFSMFRGISLGLLLNSSLMQCLSVSMETMTASGHEGGKGHDVGGLDAAQILGDVHHRNPQFIHIVTVRAKG
jgi:hypothetical protein